MRQVETIKEVEEIRIRANSTDRISYQVNAQKGERDTPYHNLEYDRARGYLDTLGTSKTEEVEFVAVQHIYLDYAADIDGYTLSPTDSITLLNAGEGYNPLAGYARTLFYKLTGTRIIRAFTHLDNSVTQRSQYGSYKNETLVPVGSIQVFPNPTDRSNIEISIPNFQTER